jgi:hypothetical protein
MVKNAFVVWKKALDKTLRHMAKHLFAMCSIKCTRQKFRAHGKLRVSENDDTFSSDKY